MKPVHSSPLPFVELPLQLIKQIIGNLNRRLGSATAYRSTILSTSLNSLLDSKSAGAISFRSLTPCCLPTAEPMSIQNGQPTSTATFAKASDFSVASTDFRRQLPLLHFHERPQQPRVICHDLDGKDDAAELPPREQVHQPDEPSGLLSFHTLDVCHGMLDARCGKARCRGA